MCCAVLCCAVLCCLSTQAFDGMERICSRNRRQRSRVPSLRVHGKVRACYSTHRVLEVSDCFFFFCFFVTAPLPSPNPNPSPFELQAAARVPLVPDSFLQMLPVASSNGTHTHTHIITVYFTTYCFGEGTFLPGGWGREVGEREREKERFRGRKPKNRRTVSMI
jgi:hypothetical protein